MLASRLSGPAQITMERVPLPEVPEGELLLRTRLFGVCGSDVHTYEIGRPGRSTAKVLPGTPGHEVIGEVVQPAGAFKEGDVVLALPPLGNGYAELVSVPPASCLPVPQGMPLDQAILAQQLGTVIHALRPVGSLLDRSVAIVGQGPAGLMFMRMVLGMGARSVVVVEPRAPRREAARRLGAPVVLDPAEPLPENSFDVVIDAAGGQQAIDTSYRLVHAFGSVLQFGLPHGAVAFDHEVAFRKQVTTYRAVHAQSETDLACFRLAFAMLERGTLPTEVLVSERFAFTQLPEALRWAADPTSSAIKVLVEV